MLFQMRRVLVGLVLSFSVAGGLSAQVNGSDTVSLDIGPGALAMANCRQLPYKRWSVAENLRNGGNGLPELMADSTSSAVCDWIDVDTSVVVRNGSDLNGAGSIKNVVIDGSIDQGDGYVLSASCFSCISWTTMTMRNDTNIVVRDIKLRPQNHDNNNSTQGASVRCTDTGNVVFSNVSFGAPDDKTFAMNGCRNASLIATFTRSHHATDATNINIIDSSDNIGLYYNFFTRVKKRNLRISALDGTITAGTVKITMVNNGFYDWKGDALQIPVGITGSEVNLDMVGNQYKPGPGTDGGKLNRVLSVEWFNSGRSTPSDTSSYGRVYLSDHVHTGTTFGGTPFNSAVPANVPDEVTFTVDSTGPAPKAQIFVASPISGVTEVFAPRDTMSGTTLWDRVDSVAGSIFRTACDGTRQYHGPDTYDSEAMIAAQDSTPIADPSDVYPIGAAIANPTCADSDGDGIGDAYTGPDVPDSVTISGLWIKEHYNYGLQLPNYLYPSASPANWRDSTFAAIVRDCLWGPLPLCKEFGTPPAGGTPTFSDSLYTYLDSLLVDTIFFGGVDTSQAGNPPNDTTIMRYFTINAVGSRGFWCGGSAAQNYWGMFSTKDDLAGETALDSATVADSLAAWGLNGECANVDALKTRILPFTSQQEDVDYALLLFLVFPGYLTRREVVA